MGAASGEQFGKGGAAVPTMTRLAKTVLSVNYTVANFAEGEV